MDGGSIITTSAAGASRAPLLPARAGQMLIRQPRFSSVPPSASRSQIHASPAATSPCSCSTPSLCDEDPSLHKEEEEDLKKKAQKWIVYSDLSIFDPAPSKEEAEAAVSALKLVSSQFVGDDAISFSKDAFDQTPLLNEKLKKVTASSSDQSKPEQPAYGSKSVLSQAQNKVCNALHLLHVNPSVQSMVVSLSSDKAVWNAVMKNERVQELRKSYYAEYAAGGSKRTAHCTDDIAAQILNWLFENAKAHVVQFIEDIIRLVNNLFNSEGKETNDTAMEIVSDVVRSSFMVSVMVFIVVILKRVA